MINQTKLLQGDCHSLMTEMESATYDAVITDPPYATGGTSTSSRRADPVAKYQSTGAKKYYPTFSNDQRDQRTHIMWMIRWLEQAHRITKDGGLLMMFTDWRQLPLSSDAIQIAGWTWQGIVTWDKTESCRPRLGMFRNQAEYVLIASKGKLQKHVPICPPGVYRSRIRPKDKLHLTGKPVDLMEHLLKLLPDDAKILDPFAGSGTTLLAAQQRGIEATGIELSTDYYNIAQTRIAPTLIS